VLYVRIIGVLAVLVMGVVFVAGCGDDGEASANVTKAEFVKEAEALCAERKKDWDAAASAFSKEYEAEELAFKEARKRSNAFFTASLLPLLTEEQEALEALDPPEEDKAQVEKMMQSRAQGIETLEDKGVNAIVNSSTFGAFEKEAKAYGLSCQLF
jgi:molecular chaperone GrpE (heat shock protein)